MALWAVPAWAQLDKSDTAPITPPLATAAGFTKAERTVKKLAPGVEWTQEITPASLPGGPLVVNVVKIRAQALQEDRLRVALGYGHVWEENRTQGREPVSGIAERTQALVAVNASFFTFQSGQPIGLTVENGALITEPTAKRSVFYLNSEGKASIAAFTGSGTVTAADGATFPLHGFNRKPGKGNEMLAFTSRFFGSTLLTPGRTEVALVGTPDTPTFNTTLSGSISVIGNGGGTLLPLQTVVLSGGGTAARFLTDHAAAGQKWTVRYDITPIVTNIRQAVAGGPRLVENGQVALADTVEGFSKAFSTGRHPRTAVGILPDGSVLLLAVDGRQPLLSRGVSLAETAALLVKFGAVSGINLDGGGSTEIVVRGLIGNSPSEGAERPVATALVLMGDAKRAAPDTPDTPLLAVSSGPMQIGSLRSFALPTSVRAKEADTVVWGIRGGIGFVSQTGRFVALRPGNGTVTANLADGRRFVAPVSVLAPPPPPPAPKPTPSPIAIPTGTTGP